MIGTTAAIVAVSIWTPFRDPSVAQRWFAWPDIAWLAPVPVLTAVLVIVEWRVLRAGSEFLPFLGASDCSCCRISALRSACGR